MGLVSVPSASSLAGGFYVQKPLKGCVGISAEITVRLGSVSESRKKTIITALKRGYSRGNPDSEQYLLYAMICKQFGLKHSKISNSRYAYIAVPTGARPQEFVVKVKDLVLPVHQLTDSSADTYSNSWYWGTANIHGQAMVNCRKPGAVPMNVFGKLLATLQGEQDKDVVTAAVEFVKGNGVITYKF